jgi:2-amino-4-hydroxy-6-hydroxymethyldihydropteridine diphosphokinase
VRWGPRTLDLDLLLYSRLGLDEPGLSVPHPRLLERRFALEPLLEAWPEAVLPDGTALAGLLAAVADQQAAVAAGPGWWAER